MGWGTQLIAIAANAESCTDFDPSEEEGRQLFPHVCVHNSQ